MTVIENETAYAYFTTHGDPYVVTDPKRALFTQVCKVDTSPPDYGKARAERIAAALNACRGIQTVKLAPGILAVLRKEVADAALLIPMQGSLAHRITMAGIEHGTQILRQDRRIDEAAEAVRKLKEEKEQLRSALRGMMLAYRFVDGILRDSKWKPEDPPLHFGGYGDYPAGEDAYRAAEALIGNQGEGRQ